jgi:hypothetical protein
LAAPYFTIAEPIVNAARAGKSVQLLIGLNSATSPEAVSATHGIPNLAVRYLTHRFHAKIYVFDDAALLGSSNLTDGGLMSNREAVICLDQREDIEAVEEVRGLFLELWESAQVLTIEKMHSNRRMHRSGARVPIQTRSSSKLLAESNRLIFTSKAKQNCVSVSFSRNYGGGSTSNTAYRSMRSLDCSRRTAFGGQSLKILGLPMKQIAF